MWRRFVAALAILLSQAPVIAQNLVVNGDFAAGSTGWTTWRAPWGSNENWDFNNTEPGHVGAACLKLGQSNTASSFGVYQQVPVTPGKTYRLDAWWRGEKLGNVNWWEILLLDGAWDIDQADSGPAATVEANYMYAYDNNTLGLAGPIGTTFGWIWGHDQNAPPNDQVDWNNRQGLRTASGFVMTVVLKAGTTSTGVAAFFDEVSLVEAEGPGDCTTFVNGDFSDGANGWTAWTVHDTGGNFSATVTGGELATSGSNYTGGAYQQFETGGAGTVVNVIGYWRSTPTLPNAMFGEVLVVNAARLPADGVDETAGVNDAVLLYRNDTFSGRPAWDDAMPDSAPVAFNVSFIANDAVATLVLKSGNNGAGLTGVNFDDLSVHCVPQPATMASLSNGFTGRTLTFPVAHMVCIAQSPTSHNLYAVSNEQTASSTRLYRVNVDDDPMTTTQITGLGSLIEFVQGFTFDSLGNLYLASKEGKIVKGVDTDPDPAVDAFTFSLIADLDNSLIGLGSGDHGVGGLAVDPGDNWLYINSGSASHYGYLSNGTPEVFAGKVNARILRATLDGGIIVTFAEGIRNSFDIAFRADGTLFGVGNGPNTNCDYAEEFNRLEENKHYGFPYEYGSDLSGGDASIVCNNGPGGNVAGPPAKPGGLVTTPGWGNYGPDAKPGPGGVGEQDGRDDVYYGFDPHCSPDGLDFYEPALMSPLAIKFPAEFHGRAFVARFGELEPIPAVGHDVVSLRLDEPNTGFLCNQFVDYGSAARPIDVLCAYNGKLYVLEYTFGGGSKVHEIAYTIPGDDPIIQVTPTAFTHTVGRDATLANDKFAVANGGSQTLNYTITDDVPWLAVAPPSNSSTGEAHIHTITYNLVGLDCGTHVGTVTVSDPNSLNQMLDIPVTIIVRSVKPDFDCDGDVDLDDHGFFQTCYSISPGNPPPYGYCDVADFDNDIDVDANDFQVLLGCLSGEAIEADSTCDGSVLELASTSRGGAMYDRWWTVAGVPAPTMNHPLWALRPDPVTNTATGSATHRCKECHGWDYQGAAGQYGAGSHHTGFPGIFTTALTGQQIFDLLKYDDQTVADGHSYGSLGLADADLWDLVKFVLQGQIDTGLYINGSGDVLGNVNYGLANYTAVCRLCHQADGTGFFPSGHDTVGETANANPWELLHKIRFGQPGTPMPNAEGSGWDLTDVIDAATYCQTLPQGQVP